MSTLVYSTAEVVAMLVESNNKVMKALGDNKVFTMNTDKKEVYCHRVPLFLPNKLLSTYSFNQIIVEVNGELRG